MAINQNHQFEDLDGVKCAIVEKNVNPERASFLKNLLEYNGFTVMIVPSSHPKSATVQVPEGGEQMPTELVINTYTLGVTDVGFNSTNAVFGRLLRTRHGKVVTVDYWQEKDNVSEDSIPYYSKKK